MAVSGTGSALDVASLVTQLVAAERAPHSLRLNRAEAGAKAKLSALGTVTAALDGLKRSLSPLKQADAFAARSATSSSDAAVAVSAGANTAPGRYEVEILALASAHKLQSAAFGSTTGFGAGRLRIEVGSAAIDVDVAAGATISDVRAAIQTAGAAAKLPLDATLVRSDGGDHLVLTARDGGSAQALRVTRASGDASLDALVYDPGTLTSLTQKQPAADAQVRVDGLLRTASSNTVSDAVPGLTLTLKAAGAGTLHTVTVARDGSAARKAVEGFVGAYNAGVAAIATNTRYDSATRTAAALNGDGLVRGAAAQLRTTLGNALAAAADAGLSAAELGLSTRVDGTLAFDGARFDAALAARPDAVRAAFAGTDGMATRLDAVLASLTGSGSGLASRTDGLNAQIRSVGTQREALETRMSALETRYRTQYTALDSLLAQLQTTSAFIAQQLG